MMTLFLIVLFTILCIALSGDRAWDNVTKPERNEVVFDGRHRGYGAFVLRREYDRRFMIAFAGSLTIVAAAVTLPRVITLFHNSSLVPASLVNVIDINLDDVIDQPQRIEEAIIHPPAVSASIMPPVGEVIVVDSARNTIDTTSAPLLVPDTSGHITDDGKKGPLGDPHKGPIGTGPEGPDLLPFGSALKEVPEFPGGASAMYRFLNNNIVFPAEAMRNDWSDRVYVEFVIEADGNIGSAQVVKGEHDVFKHEAMRVVKAMPRWSPGKMDGHPVRCRLVLPVSFTLQL